MLTVYFVRNSAQANKPETNYHNYIQNPIIFNYTFWLVTCKKSSSAHAKLENMLRFAMQMFSQLRWCLFTAAASLSLLRILLTWSDKHIVATTRHQTLAPSSSQSCSIGILRIVMIFICLDFQAVVLLSSHNSHMPDGILIMHNLTLIQVTRSRTHAGSGHIRIHL